MKTVRAKLNRKWTKNAQKIDKETIDRNWTENGQKMD